MEKFASEETRKSNSFDFRRFLFKVLRNYLWLLASVIIFVGCAYVYLRYTVPLYQVAAFLQIEATPDGVSMIGGSPFSGTGGSKPREQYKDLNSEMFKLHSVPLVTEVVDSMKLNISVTLNGRVKHQPIFLDVLPFSIDVLNPVDNRKEVEFILKLSDTSYSIQTGNRSLYANYGMPLVIDDNTIQVSLRAPLETVNSSEYKLVISDRMKAVDKYNGRIAVGSVPKGGYGMLQVMVRDEIAERAKKFIEVLKYKYDYSNYVFRNRALQSEIEFLDQRVAAVDKELEQQENYVKNFKAGNKITDVNSSANQLLGNLASIESKKNDNEYKENLLNLVESNINSGVGKEERINVTGLQDQDLGTLVGKYNDLVSQKINIELQAAPKDLRLPPINSKLQETRNSIMNRVRSLKEELSTSNAFLRSQEKNAASLFSTMPGKEKDLIQVNRLLNIKQSLYVFLLQRKEDKSIEFASSGMGDSRMVDWKVSHVQDPKPIVLYGIALMIGILVPTIIILLRTVLNKRVETSTDITKATLLPVIGEIAYAGKISFEKIVIMDGTSPVAEHFRTMRTNLFFHCHGRSSNVIMVTSGISGEGKSYISLNLASAIAISGKRTILVEFDLRNPGIMRDEQITKNPGVINFLTENISIEHVIQQVEGCNHLSFISSGLPLTVNTGEILLNSKMRLLFDYLKRHFEYIIIDTPPVEAVSDALILSEWADFTLFVIRHKYSSRSSIDLINKLHEDSKTRNALLVINGIQPGGDFNNVHGYGYGYSANDPKRKKRTRQQLKIA